MPEQREQCPEFPHFGAKYPDALCIDGFLWDLDKCDVTGLYGGGNDPCPFCNTDKYREFLGYEDEDTDGKVRIDNHINFLKHKFQ